MPRMASHAAVTYRIAFSCKSARAGAARRCCAHAAGRPADERCARARAKARAHARTLGAARGYIARSLARPGGPARCGAPACERLLRDAAHDSPCHGRAVRAHALFICTPRACPGAGGTHTRRCHVVDAGVSPVVPSSAPASPRARVRAATHTLSHLFSIHSLRVWELLYASATTAAAAATAATTPAAAAAPAPDEAPVEHDAMEEPGPLLSAVQLLDGAAPAGGAVPVPLHFASCEGLRFKEVRRRGNIAPVWLGDIAGKQIFATVVELPLTV